MRVCPKSKNLALVVDVFPQTVYPRGFFNAEKMNTQEIWKPVAECNGEYYVSNWGRVKSYKNGKERILKHWIVKGYAFVQLSKNQKKKSMSIHRLVADSFIANPLNKETVNHKDGNKTNNCLDNLEWMTLKENVQHAWQNGLCEKKRFALGKTKRKPVMDIVSGKKYDSLTLACKDIGENYGTHTSRIFYKRKLQRFFYITDGNR